MIAAIVKALWRIRNYDRIPKLPRGMLATKYEHIPADGRRVMARLGARDPRGVAIAMRRAGVESVDDLIEQLEHFRPQHRFRARLSRAIGRVLGAYDHPPHRAELIQDAIAARRARKNVEVLERLEQAERLMRS